MKKILTLLILFILSSGASPGQEYTITTHRGATGPSFSIDFQAGSSHNHPLMVFWVEDTAGNYIETLYVARSIATSVFEHGKAGKQGWEPGIQRRPAALPYWGHKRGIKAKDDYYAPHPDNPMPDAITGPTPQKDFTLHSRMDSSVSAPVRILMEINQPWDWNEFWTNSKFPGDKQYMTSSQPALVYAATLSSFQPGKSYNFELIGRSHHSGKNGKLFKDLETLTTAKNIVKSLHLTVSDHE